MDRTLEGQMNPVSTKFKSVSKYPTNIDVYHSSFFGKGCLSFQLLC